MALSAPLYCNEVQAKRSEADEIINLFSQVSWRIVANNKIVDADESNWITQEKYSKSIIKVIGQAAADCITGQNEFANKGEGDVITFNVDAKTYSPENWNAVVLWNYLHILKHDFLKGKKRNTDEIFGELKTTVYGHYETKGIAELNDKIDKAIRDIKAYDKALSLSDEMNKFFAVGKATRGRTLEDLVRNNTCMSPIATWDILGLHDEKVGEDNINISDIIHVRLTPYMNTALFVPIKVMVDDILYYIKHYVFYRDLKFDFFSKNALKLDDFEYGGTKSLGGLTKNEKDKNYFNHHYFEIIDKIRDKAVKLFDDLGFRLLKWR